LGIATTQFHAEVVLRYNRRFKETRDREDEVMLLQDFIAVKGMRALGNKLSSLPVVEVSLNPRNEELESSALAVHKATHSPEATIAEAKAEEVELPPAQGPKLEAGEGSPFKKRTTRADDSSQPTLF
jgi:hypothetical protein